MTTFTPTWGEDAGPPSDGGGGGVQTRTGQVVLTANSGQYQQQMSAAQASTLGVGAAVDTLFTKIDNLFKIGGRTLQIMGAADVASIAAGTANLAAMQQQISPLIGQSAALRQSLAPVRGAIDQAFATLPVHQANAAAMVQTISRLSVAPRDLASLTRTSLQLNALTGDANLGPNLIQLGRQYGATTAPQVARSANALITTSGRQGVDPTSVVQFGQAIAPIARQAGITEAAVLGIGTAFSKAGADGYYAANTFNSVLGDITQLTRTGSPELAKYSQFLGMTVGQFRKMPAAQQMTQLFDAINKGGPQALVLMNELGLGTRGISAVQGVAQTGGLGPAIAMAQRSSANTRNLNRGANAAMSGLDDQGTRLHNQLTRIADIFAGPFFGALTLVTRGLADLAGGVADLLQHLGPIPGLLAGVAGLLLPIAGLALTHLPLVGLAAGARLLTRSGPARAFREGRAVAGGIAGGMTEAEATAAYATTGMYGAGARMRTRYPFQAGMWMGGRAGPAAAAEEAAAGGAPGAAAMGKAYFAKGVFGVPAYMYGTQARQMRDSMVPDYARSAYTRTGPTGMAGMAANAEALARQESMMAMLSSEGRNMVRQLGSLAVAAPASMFGMMGAGAGRLAGGAGGFMAKAGSALASPLGLAALLLGPTAISGISGFIGSRAAQPYQIGDTLNPVSKYDQLLGTTSTNLAKFSSAVSDAAAKVSTLGGQSLRTISHVTGADIATATSGSYKVTDTNFATLAGASGNAVAPAVAYMRTLAGEHGKMDPNTFNAIKQDLINTYGAPRAQQILSSYLTSTSGPTNYSALGGAASGQGNTAYRAIIGAAVSGIGARSQVAPGRQSNAAQLSTVLQLGASSLAGKGFSGTNLESFRAYMAQVFGGKPDDYNTVTRAQIAGSYRAPQVLTNLIGAQFSTQGGARSQLVAALLHAAQQPGSGAAKYLAGLGINPNTPAGQSALMHLIASPQSFPGAAANQQISQIASYGQLGTFAAGSGLFQRAIGPGASSPSTQSRAAEQLAIEASATSANMGLASTRLMVLSDKLGGASTASGQVAAAAAQWARTLQSFQMPYLSRAGQLGVLAGNLRQSSAAAARPGASQATIDTYHQDQQAYEQSKASYYQYLQQVFVAARDFHIQMQRSEADYQLQIYRTDRNFQLQQLYAAQDFHRQMFRSHQDFNIQMARESQKAAEQIYNPYQTVQAQSVVSAGILESNLEDQNSRIQTQLAQLRQLRRAGLSQQAIDMLQLADPNNAQQLNGIVSSVLHDPGIIKKINDEIKIRGHATTALTQSDFNVDFRNTVADFERQLNRAGQDYQRAHERAVTQQQITLEDMSVDFNTMVDRTAQDLTNQMTELYGSYADQYGKTLEKINKDIGKYAPKLAETLTKELAKANKAILHTEQGALGGGPSNTGPGGTTGGGATGSKKDPIYTAGTVGINAAGNVGHYDKSGHFHPNKGYISPSEAASLPHIGNPKKAPQNIPAGSATGAQRYAQSRFAHYGWGQDQFPYLLSLWNQESNWRSTARNASSGALGIAQALGHGVAGQGAWAQTDQGRLFVNEYPTKAANAGSPSAQIDWGLNYIASVYRSPQGARQHEDTHNWYGTGGIFNRPTVIGVGERGDEMVLPLDHRGQNFMAGMWTEVARMLTANKGVAGQAIGGSTYNHYDRRVQITGPVQVQTPNASKFLGDMAAKQRLDRLMGAGAAGP